MCWASEITVDERIGPPAIAKLHEACYRYAQMNLPEYIRSIGIRAFCERFDITERAAIAYRHRARRPRPEVAQRIVEGSPVTWEGIYAPKAPASTN